MFWLPMVCNTFLDGGGGLCTLTTAGAVISTSMGWGVAWLLFANASNGVLALARDPDRDGVLGFVPCFALAFDETPLVSAVFSLDPCV